MAKRKEEGFLDLLAVLPWWVGVSCAVVGYVALRFVVPMIKFDNAIINAIPATAPHIAWLAAIFLLPAAVSAITSFRKRRLSNKQDGIEALGSQKAVAGEIASPPLSRTRATPAVTDITRCPQCGGVLIVRQAKHGSRIGTKFWGCSNYPNCRHTEAFAG